MRKLALLLLALSAPALADSGVSALESLVKGERYADAYEAAQALVSESAGDPNFDFLYGLAAYHTGRLHEALLAFERVVLVQPNNHRARLELARAQFSLGDYARAKEEFERVLAIDPPAAVAARIQGFLDAIERRQALSDTRWEGSVALAGGYDTNINSATSATQVVVLGLPFQLSDQSRAIESSFVDLSANATLTHPLSKTRGLYGLVGFQNRTNAETSDFDLNILGLSAGYVQVDGANRWRLPLQVQQLFLDGELYRSLYAVGADYMRTLDRRQELSLYAQLGVTSYPDAEVRDATVYTLGTGWNFRFDSGGAFSATAYVGAEDADADYHDRRFIASRLGFTQPLSADHSVGVAVTGQWARYGGDFPLFGVPRKERYKEAQVFWRWALTPAWALKTQVSWADNYSNIALYDYDRWQAQAGVSYEFK